MRTIVVAGALANRPSNGGGAAVRMTWIAALRRLGFEVWFLEQARRDSLSRGGPAPEPIDRSAGVRYFRRLTRRFALEGRSALLDENGAVVAGAAREDVDSAAERAEMLLNLGGNLALPELLERFRLKVYLDLDPGYTQLWHVLGESAARLDNHDLYFTVGLNVGSPACSLPTGSIDWKPLPPPVLLDDGPAEGGEFAAFTTVASWRGPFGRPLLHGRSAGIKAHEFRKVIALPQLAPGEFEIALDIHPGDSADRDALLAHGWRLVDPLSCTADPDSYRDYVRGSSAEFSVAQGIYVESASGWLSDRTARYLAAGRPALVQDTGLAETLPVGSGLVPFRNLDEAVSGAAAIVGDYAAHRAAAIRLAREFLDSDRVAGRLLEAAGLPGARS